MSNETDIVHKHIVAVLKANGSYAAKLPGGVWKGVAPDGTKYPHLIMAYASGIDVLAFSGGYIGAGMEYLLKVVDASPSDAKAVDSFNWVETTLMGLSGINATGLAYVYFDKLRPFTLPVVEDDILFQQDGRSFTVFVDLIGI